MSDGLTPPIWLLLTGLPSLLYAITNHIDKHLLDRHLQGDLGVNTLVMVSALVSGLALPFLWGFSPDGLLPEAWTHLAAFAAIGALHVALLWFYLTALNQEDTTTIIVFYALLPLMGWGAGNLFLGEPLSQPQLFAMGLIILGVVIVSIKLGARQTVIVKWRTLGLMGLTSLCWALSDVVFKAVALEGSVRRTLFFEHLILLTFGLMMYGVSPRLRRELRNLRSQNANRIVALNLTNEALYLTANITAAFPLVMVSVAAVHLVQAFQPVWVFLIALGLTLTGYSARLNRSELIQKLVATTLATSGVYLLALHTPSA